jgi:hypothetical protein
VTVGNDGKVVVRARPEDAITRVKKLHLREKVAAGALTNAERDLVLLALLQAHGLL